MEDGEEVTRYALRMTPAQARGVRLQAAYEGVSKNAVICRAINDYLRRERKKGVVYDQEEGD